MSVLASGAPLPSVQWLQDEIVGCLSQRKSVWVLVPRTVDARAVLGGVEDSLERRGAHLAPLRLTQCAKYLCDPKRFVEVALGVGSNGLSIVDALCTDSAPDVLALEEVEDLSVAEQSHLVALGGAWGEAAKAIADRGERPPCLLVTGSLNNGVPLPARDLFTEVLWWWGIPSALDLRLLVRQRAGRADGAAGAWREHVIPSLANHDPELVDELWDACCGSHEVVLTTLKSYADRRGWTRWIEENGGTRLNDWSHAAKVTNGSLSPPSAYLDLWSQGFLGETPEFGIELHSAALACLGRSDLVHKRLWRGQAGLVLPLLDAIRIRVCLSLTDQQGSDWGTRWERPREADEAKAVEEDPTAAGWGFLYHLLNDLDALRASRGLLRIVRLGRGLRNRIAHQRPLDFFDFQRLAEAAGDPSLLPEAYTTPPI